MNAVSTTPIAVKMTTTRKTTRTGHETAALARSSAEASGPSVKGRSRRDPVHPENVRKLIEAPGVNLGHQLQVSSRNLWQRRPGIGSGHKKELDVGKLRHFGSDQKVAPETVWQIVRNRLRIVAQNRIVRPERSRSAPPPPDDSRGAIHPDSG